MPLLFARVRSLLSPHCCLPAKLWSLSSTHPLRRYEALRRRQLLPELVKTIGSRPNWEPLFLVMSQVFGNGILASQFKPTPLSSTLATRIVTALGSIIKIPLPSSILFVSFRVIANLLHARIK